MKSLMKDRRGHFGFMAAILAPVLIGSAGFLIDFSHVLLQKSELQAAIDSAVLATSKVDLKDQDLKARFHQEFAGAYGEQPADFAHFLLEVHEQKGLNFASVEATARVSMKTKFMHILGSDTFDFKVSSSAYEARSNVEISLVLDISSSMNSKKLQELKAASRQFIDEILTDEVIDSDLVTISLVPYGGSVRLPRFLSDVVKVDANPDIWKDRYWNGCLQYKPSDFHGSYIAGKAFGPIAYQWKYGKHSGNRNPWCPSEGNELIEPTNDRDKLLDAVSALTRSDGTGTDHGVLWGLKTLSPDWHRKFPGSVGDRPLKTDKNNLKFMIVMTDGGTTSQFGLSNQDRGKVRAKPNKTREPGAGARDRVKADRRIYSGGQANQNVAAACNAAKAIDVTIFTIGFDVPDGKVKHLQKCASSPSKYFNVEKNELSETFSNIAAEISPVRLVK